MEDKKDTITSQIEDMTRRMKSQMPRILREIEIYEQKTRTGNLTKNPKVAPQFKK